MNIVRLISQFATPEERSQVSSLIGGSPEQARNGLGAAVPAILAALLGTARQPGAAQALGTALSRSGGLGDLLASDLAAAASTGAGFVSSLIGAGRAEALTGALGSYAGVPKTGAGSLLGLAGAMVLGGLGREATEKGLDGAGVLGMLDAQKDEIGKALPADFVRLLGGSGLLAGLGTAAAAAPRPATPNPAASAAPPLPAPRRGGWTRWVIGLIVLAILAWAGLRLFAPKPEPVVEAAPPTTSESVGTAPAPPAATTAEPAAPAATMAEPAVPADPLMVGGVDVGAGVRGVLDTVTGSFDGITDAASAQAALPKLVEARDTLNGLEIAVAGMQDAGHAALKGLVQSALPAIQTAAERLLDDGAVAPVVKPVVDDILAKLNAFAA